jgi:hypothetical protein
MAELMIDNAPITDREHKAKSLVYGLVKSDFETPLDFSMEHVKLVWFSKVLENWKALVITLLPDNLYYEVTYSGKHNDIVVDMYEKVSSIKVTLDD